MADMLTIGGNAIPEGNVYNVGVMDIVANAFRDVNNGTAQADFIAQKVKIEVAYPYLSSSDYSDILGYISASYFFTVVYVDPRTGTTTSGTFYCSDRTAGTFKFNATTGEVSWKDVKFNLIEQ